MNLPPFVKSLKFWSAVSWTIAGVLGLLVYFGKLPPSYNYDAAAILVAIQTLLKIIDVVPEFKGK